MSETNGDLQGTKEQAKAAAKAVGQKAFEVFKPKMATVLGEALAGFEVKADDTRTKKEIFRAAVQALAIHMSEAEGMQLSKLAGTAQRGVTKLIPPPVYVDEAGDDSEDESGTYESGDDESDDIH